MRPLATPMLCGLLLAALSSPRAAAQGVSLTLSSAPNVFPAPTVTDFNNGFVLSPTGIGFTVDVLSGSTARNRTSIVSIRASSATLGSGKPVSDLQWRRSDLATWNSMTTSNVTIESRTIRRNNTNDPWSNTVFFRILLSWTATGPATYSTGMVITLTITTP
jgi:hypothetical protein